MKIKIPIYLSALIKKYPLILNGRRNLKGNYQRIIETKRLINDFKLRKKSYSLFSKKIY